MKVAMHQLLYDNTRKKKCELCKYFLKSYNTNYNQSIDLCNVVKIHSQPYLRMGMDNYLVNHTERIDYIEAFWNIVNREEVAGRQEDTLIFWH